VVAFAVLICARLPNIILEGRFWGEDARPAFRQAWTLPWYNALIDSHGGYVSLVPNLAGLLARHLAPLEYAPYVCIAVALLIQVCPAILLATARDQWLSGRIRLVAALLLVATPPVSEEVWLSTSHTQEHLALCTALILALDVRGRSMALFRLALLVLAAFTGPGAWALIPFFAFRAAADRSWGRGVQTVVLVAATIIQLLFFFRLRPERAFATPQTQLLIFFVRDLVIPLLGHQQALKIAAALPAEVAAGHAPVWPMALTVLVFGGFAAVIFWQRIQPAIWMFASGITLAVLGYSFAFEGGANLLYVDFGLHYSFAPNVLFALSWLALASLGRNDTRIVASAVVVWLIAVGAHEYFVPSAPYFASGPNWRSEVAAWRADPNYLLRIWPETWLMPLPPNAR
jgi:hypothetical protein